MARYYGITLVVHLSVIHPSVLLFLDDNLSKSQWIFTKLGVCIVEICFGIANGQILSIFDRVIYLRHCNGEVLSFDVFVLRKKYS